MINLDDIEAKAKAALPTSWPEEATIESMMFHQAISPETVLALVRVARAAQHAIKETAYDGHWLNMLEEALQTLDKGEG